MTPVFVYGTLKRGFRLNGAIESQQFLGEAVTASPSYNMTFFSPYAFPAVVSGEHYVTGEVYMVDDNILCRLDNIESAYNRTPVKVIINETGEEIEAGIYIFRHNRMQHDVTPDENNTQTWVVARDNYTKQYATRPVVQVVTPITKSSSVAKRIYELFLEKIQVVTKP